MGFRAPGANRCKGLRRAALVIGLLRCRSDLLCHESIVATQTGGEKNSRSGGNDRWEVCRIKILIMAPHGPDDAGQFVGQGHGRLVMTDAPLEIDGPLIHTVEGFCGLSAELFGARQHRSGPMDDEGTQIGVALFGDTAEESTVPATRLLRCDTEPGGEMAARLEGLGGTCCGDQRDGGE